MNRDRDRVRVILALCQRWLEKADKYDKADLAGSFDAFFSVFVAYNALYSEVTDRLISQDTLADRRENRFEVNKAAANVALYLGPTPMANEIRGDPKCRESVHEFVQLIKNKTFYIHITKKGSPNRASDQKCVEGIEKGADKEYCESILKLIYYTRCNMFHGSKEFVPKQPDLLNPMTKVLRTVVGRLIISLNGPIVRDAVVD